MMIQCVSVSATGQARPSFFVEEHLDLQFLHAGLDCGEADLAIALHSMAVARIDERSRLPHWYVECRSFGQLAKIKIACVWAWRHRVGHAQAQKAENSHRVAPRPSNVVARPDWVEPGDDIVATALIPVELPGKAVRVQVTMDEALLHRIDSAASAEGFTRSGFLAQAARERLSRTKAERGP
jgi:hypothetical protein